MKILSLYVKSFGKLKDVNLTFHDGINVISNVNGFGKTTMANFIRAMLYGFTYGRTKGLTDAAHFAPWDSTDKFGGTINLEHNGVTYRVERFFGKVARSEELTVTDAKTNKVINLPCSAGEYFLGLSADSYDRSAYFPQEAVEMSSNDNFENKLANLVENSDVDYDKAQKNLRDYKRTLRLERGDGGKIFELTTKKLDFEREYNRAITAERRDAEITKRLAEISNTKQTLIAKQAETKKRADKLKQQISAAALTQTDKDNVGKVNALEAKIARVPAEIEQDKLALDELANSAANVKDDVKPRIYPNFAVLSVAIVLVIAGLVLCFATLPKTWGIIVGLIVVALGAAGVGLSFIRKGAKTLPAGEKDALISQYFAIAGKYVCVTDLDYNGAIKEFWKFYSDYLGDKRELQTLRAVVKKPDNNAAELQNDVDKLESELDGIATTLTSLAGEVGRLTQEQKSLSFDTVTPREQIAKLEEQITEAEKRYKIASKVGELLAQAKDNLSSSYLPRLCNRCGELLNSVTNGAYQVVIDRTFAVQLREKSQTKPLNEFSRGVREITFLCFRVALAELLYDGKIPFVIIDDAFVNFDEENFVRATNLIKTIAQNGQVVYFTCHKRMGNLLK